MSDTKERLLGGVRLGPTGDFPRGKLNQEDEGGINIAVHGGGDDGRTVIIEFGKPVAWVGLPPEQAIQLALLLMKHAGAKR